MTKDKSLVGFWALLDTGEFYNTGQIEDQFEGGYCLIRIHSVNGCPERLSIFHLDQMTNPPAGGCVFFLFEDKLKFDAWMSWLEQPSKTPKIVSLNTKKFSGSGPND